MQSIIFFDINGTLIKRDERTDIPFSKAVNKLLDSSEAMSGIDTSARSDKDVFLEILRKFEISFEDRLWDEFLDVYKEELESFKNTDVWRDNVDAVPFVKKLKKFGYPLALITGELSIGAEYKLRKIGIWDCFLTGGYGEDGLKRYDIAEKALEKVKKIKSISCLEIFVVGDTVLDIKTAKHINAKSIAITTGSYSRSKLMSGKPDYCIDCFSEVEELFLGK